MVNIREIMARDEELKVFTFTNTGKSEDVLSKIKSIDNVVEKSTFQKLALVSELSSKYYDNDYKTVANLVGMSASNVRKYNAVVNKFYYRLTDKDKVTYTLNVNLANFSFSALVELLGADLKDIVKAIKSGEISAETSCGDLRKWRESLKAIETEAVETETEESESETETETETEESKTEPDKAYTVAQIIKAFYGLVDDETLGKALARLDR